MSIRQNNKPLYANAKSLPLSLRHTDKSDVLLQAECLTQFLQTATSSILKDKGNLPDGDCAYGLDLTFSLLRDKLAIASGSLDVPMASVLDDAPVWNPEGGRYE